MAEAVPQSSKTTPNPLRPPPARRDTPRILHLDHLPDLRSTLDRHMEYDLRPCVIRTRFIADTPVTPLRLATDKLHASVTVLIHHDVDDPVSQEYRSPAFFAHESSSPFNTLSSSSFESSKSSRSIKYDSRLLTRIWSLAISAYKSLINAMSLGTGS